jgi:hypothetical protein
LDLEATDREAQIHASMAARLLEWADPILSDEECKVQERIFSLMRAGEVIDPQLAVQAWAELHSFRRLRALLVRKIRHGEKVAQRTPISL